MEASSEEPKPRGEQLSAQDRATIADRRRIWEVRKYCQIKPSIAQYSRDVKSLERRSSKESISHTGKDFGGDPALTALLRGVLVQLEADVAMVSLLDDNTQFFLSGATSENLNDAEITLQSAQWYGCDDVSHHGGLCESTISLKHEPGVPTFFEICDMSMTERTQHLPFVNGTVAKFRHYAGTPITTSNGINIGTIFIMRSEPSATGMTPSQRAYMYETSKHVMGQLVQAVQALEGKRAERYNSTVSSLLNGRAYEQLQQQPHDLSNQDEQPVQVASIYKTAARLLHDFFDLAGLVFQEIPLSRRKSRKSSNTRKDKILASELEPGMEAIVPMKLRAVHNLLDRFPSGAVLHLDEQESEPAFFGAEHTIVTDLEPETNASLGRSFPGARQIIFVPLYDALHSRTAALCLGWVVDDKRVYQSGTDLAAMSAFCMATMSHVLRMESQMLDQVKSDFLGSISHETRSPLHNVLGNLELLLGTNCDAEQREMLINARFGATQLLETIDKILLYSRVQGPSSSGSTRKALETAASEPVPDQDEDQDRGRIQQIGERHGDVGNASGNTDLIGLCEEVVEDVAKRMRLSHTIMADERDSDSDGTSADRESVRDTRSGSRGGSRNQFSIIVFDARSTDNYQVRSSTGFRIILENLLSNAIKFTRTGCCVRASLSLSADYCQLEVVDCGRGFSRDFVRHSLYVPFAQQDPVDTGIGLGLSLVKRNAETLEGTVQIDTEETLGSTVTISIPLANLTADVEQNPGRNAYGRGGTALKPPMPKDPPADMPVLKACVYAPSDWMRRNDKRDQRSVELLHQSLSHTLGAWVQPKISIWQQSAEHDELPDLVFVAQTDLKIFAEVAGEEFKDVKTIVVCADVGKNSEYDQRKIDDASSVADAIITGSIIPSKLWKAVTMFFPHIVPVVEGGEEGVDAGGLDQSEENRHSDDASTSNIEPAEDDAHEHEQSPGGETGNLPVLLPYRGSARPDYDDRHDSRNDTKIQGSERPLLMRTPPSADWAAQDMSNGQPQGNAGPTSESSTPDTKATEPGEEATAGTADEDEGLIFTKAADGADEDGPRADDNDEDHHSSSQSSIALSKALPGTGSTSRRPSNSSTRSEILAQPRLLLVDDNNVNLKMLSMFVKKSGVPTTAYSMATGGQQAISMYEEAAGEGGFDIVFMDLSMPDVSGFDATAAIRRIEEGRGMGKRAYIAALTGLVSEKDRKAALVAGTNDYITKPAGLKNVEAVLEKWRDVRRSSLFVHSDEMDGPSEG